MTTNLERIRQMTADELAEIIGNDECKYCIAHKFCKTKSDCCQNIIQQWLEQESEE